MWLLTLSYWWLFISLIWVFMSLFSTFLFYNNKYNKDQKTDAELVTGVFIYFYLIKSLYILMWGHITTLISSQFILQRDCIASEYWVVWVFVLCRYFWRWKHLDPVCYHFIEKTGEYSSTIFCVLHEKENYSRTWR